MVVMTPIELQARDALASETPSVGRPVAWTPAWGGLLGAADALAFAASLGAAHLAARLAGADAAQAGAVLAVMAALAAIAMLCFLARGHYGHWPQPAQVRDAVAACAAGLLGTGLAAYALRLDAGMAPLLAMWGASVPALLLGRGLGHAALRRMGAWERRAIVVGTGDAAARALSLLREGASRDWAVAAVLHPSRMGATAHGHWRSMLHQHQADLVVLAMDDPPRALAERLVRDRVPFATVPRPDGFPVHGAAPMRLLGQDAVLWSYRDNLRRPAARAAKLAIDMAGAFALLVALAPVLLLIAAAIKLDGGSVLYAHRRIGAGGRGFPCLKFRSMVPNGDEALAEVLHADPAAAAEWVATRKLRRDPRVTAIGRVLRQTSLDELPQLFNVLRGEMSLVGPRPIVAAEVPRYGEDIHYYYAARPGLTGLWQVSGRSDTGYTQRVQLDAWYVRNWSLRHDLMILAKTLPAVLKRRGAV